MGPPQSGHPEPGDPANSCRLMTDGEVLKAVSGR